MVGIPRRGFRRAGAPPSWASTRRHRRAAFAALLALGGPGVLGAQRPEPVGARRPAAVPSVGSAVASQVGTAAPPPSRTRLAVPGAGPPAPHAPAVLLPPALPRAGWDGRRRKGPFLWGGAAVGAVATGLALVVQARQDNGDYDDYGAYAIVPAMAVGAALGAGVGYLVYRVAGP